MRGIVGIRGRSLFATLILKIEGKFGSPGKQYNSTATSGDPKKGRTGFCGKLKGERRESIKSMEYDNSRAAELVGEKQYNLYHGLQGERG